MKRTALVLALMAFPILAQAGDLEIIFQRKKENDGSSKDKPYENSSKTSQKWIGEIKIANHGFKPSPAVEVRYMLFVKRQQLGQKFGTDQIEKIKGNAKVEPIKTGTNATVFTSEVNLAQQQLDPGWHFKNGGMAKAEDNVTGVWIRLFNGATEVAEFVNNPSTKEKFKWEQ